MTLTTTKMLYDALEEKLPPGSEFEVTENEWGMRLHVKVRHGLSRWRFWRRGGERSDTVRRVLHWCRMVMPAHVTLSVEWWR